MVKNISIFLAGILSGYIVFSVFPPKALQQESSNSDHYSEVIDRTTEKAVENNTQSASSTSASQQTLSQNQIDSAQAVEQHASTLEKMQSEIASLQKQNEALQERISDTPTDPNSATFDDSKIMSEKEAQQHLSEQLQQHVPMPFLKLTHAMEPIAQMDVIKMHESQDDYGWGYDVEIKIQDFFLTEFDATQIQLSGVTCRQQRCEILVTLNDEVYSKDIFTSLRNQPWWKFGNTNSRSSNGDDDNTLIMYIFASAWRDDS